MSGDEGAMRDSRSALRGKTNEELLSIMSGLTEAESDLEEEIRDIFIERKVVFPTDKPSVQNPGPGRPGYSIAATIGVAAINLLFCGPLTMVIIFKVASSYIPSGGDFVGAVPALLVSFPATLLTLTLSNLALFIYSRKRMKLYKFGGGFLIAAWIWGLLLIIFLIKFISMLPSR